MVCLFQNLDFSIGSLSIGGMLESIKYFFKGIDLFGYTVLYFPNVPIRSRSNLLQDVEFFQHMVFNLASLSLHYLYNYIFKIDSNSLFVIMANHSAEARN